MNNEAKKEMLSKFADLEATSKAIFMASDLRSLLEALAKEANELSQAALKTVRAFDLIDSPTDVSCEDAVNALLEECSDVVLCAEALSLNPDIDTMVKKAHRWLDRLKKSSSKDVDEQLSDRLSELIKHLFG